MMSTNVCPGCNSQLKFLNTPNFGGGKLSDGNRVCRSCFKILAKQDVSFGLKSKKNYNSEMVVAIIQKGNQKYNILDRPIPVSTTHEIIIPSGIEDDIDTDFDQSEKGQDIIDTIVLIKYQDSRGNISSRRITIKSIDNSKVDHLIKAYCHERKAARSFKLSGIIEIVDIETGEVFGNPKDFILSKSDVNNTSEINNCLNEIKHELLIMTYMAKSDGYFHPRERKVVLSFILSECNKPFDPKSIDSEIRRFHCDSGTFRNSLEKLSTKGKDHKMKIYSVLEELAHSDGEIDPIEKGILELISQKWY